MLRVLRGDLVAGLAALRAAVGELRERELTLSYPARLGDLAEAAGVAGQVAEGLASIEEALRLSERNDERWCTAELLRIKAELVLMEDCSQAVPAAKALFVESLGWARRQAALSWELRTSLGLARLLRCMGRPAEAHRLVASVYERFTEGFETADLVAARMFLRDLGTACTGRP